jgi:hypothetical protein
MICYVLGLSPTQIKALRETPSLASDVAKVRLDELSKSRLSTAAQARLRHMVEQSPLGREQQARLDEARPRVDRIGPFEEVLDLKKTWHILHYVFTGHVGAWEAPGDALLTGHELGDDVGYGPARLHDERETEKFAHFLNALDVERLQARVNYREMLRIRETSPYQIGVYSAYPEPLGQGSDTEHERELRAIVATYFPHLRDYTATIAEKQYGLLIWLS